MLKIAIVGGGPSAACVVEALAHHSALRGQVSVTVFEPAPRLWHGQVFQPDGDEVLANVPMSAMSLRAWDPDHGVRWLQDQGFGSYATMGQFPPRWLVGRYMQDAAGGAVAALDAAGSSAQIEPFAVHSLALSEGDLWARGDGWVRGPFDHAVLCVGAPPSYDPYQLSGHPGFIRDPYPLRSSLAEVPDNARVAVIGSGLTAVDTVMALRARGHGGPIAMVSRNGLLNSVRGAPHEHAFRHLTVPQLEALAAREGGLRLADVHALLAADLRDAGVDVEAMAADLASSAPPVEQLRHDLDRAREGDPAGALLRDRMVACGQDAWYLLRDEDRPLARARHQMIMRHCCPMPPGNAERLLEMFGSGQLDVIRGVTSIRPRGHGFELRAERDLEADVVIAACTPATHEPPPASRPLLAALVAQRLAVPHPFGGVHVERHTSRLFSPGGTQDRRLYALGDLTAGAYLFTFGMPVLAARADCIVRDVVTALEGVREEPVAVGNEM